MDAITQMPQQSFSSTRKDSRRGSLPLPTDEVGLLSNAFPGRAPWEQSFHHGSRTAHFQYESSMASGLEPHDIGLFAFDGTGPALPMTHDATLLIPEGMDDSYLYDALFDASPQYASSKASLSSSGGSHHIGPWNHSILTGAERSMTNQSPIAQLGMMPGAPVFDNFEGVVSSDFGSNQLPWDQKIPTSPSQNSSVTGSLSNSVAMDFSRRNSMTYPSLPIARNSVERAQFDAYTTQAAAATPASGVNEVVVKRRKQSAKGTKAKGWKTTIPIVETPSASEYPTPSSKSNLSGASAADEEHTSLGHEVPETRLTNGLHQPRPGLNLFQNQQTPRGSQRQRNRQAATKCREKTKAAMAHLEATERAITLEHMELSKTVTELRAEVLALKNELLLHGNCDCEVIQQYLRNAARNIGEAGSLTHNPGQGSAAPWRNPPQPGRRNSHS